MNKNKKVDWSRMKEKLKREREEEDRFKNQNQIEKKIFSDFRIKEWNKEEDDCVWQYKKISIFSKDRGRHSPKERKKTLTKRFAYAYTIITIDIIKEKHCRRALKKIYPALNEESKRNKDRGRQSGTTEKTDVETSAEGGGAEFRSIANYAVAGKPPRLVHGSELG